MIGLEDIIGNAVNNVVKGNPPVTPPITPPPATKPDETPTLTLPPELKEVVGEDVPAFITSFKSLKEKAEAADKFPELETQYKTQLAERDGLIKNLSIAHSSDYKDNALKPLQRKQKTFHELVGGESVAKEIAAVYKDTLLTDAQTQEKVRTLLTEADSQSPYTEVKNALYEYLDAYEAHQKYLEDWDKTKKEQRIETERKQQEASKVDYENYVQTRNKISADTVTLLSTELSDLGLEPADVQTVVNKWAESIDKVVKGEAPSLEDSAKIASAGNLLLGNLAYFKELKRKADRLDTIEGKEPGGKGRSGGGGGGNSGGAIGLAGLLGRK